ncbi:MAG: TonB family protein [Chryseolinea sp.]
MNDLKNDIERYFKGELTPSEMHALEKKALSDPFLADALEGASEVNADAFESDVHDLQMLIDKRTDQSKKAIPLWNWPLRIAAGLALITVSTFVILNIVKDNTSEQLAENKVELKSPPVSSEQKDQTPLLDSIEQPKQSWAISEAKPKLSEPAKIIATPLEKPSAVAEPTIVASQQASGDADAPSVKKDEIAKRTEEEVQIAAEQKDALAYSPSKKIEAKEDVAKDSDRKAVGAQDGYVNFSDTRDRKALANNVRVVKGHVSSIEDGSALPGVNVFIKGTNTGTVTDAEGNYEISLNDHQDELVFSFIGLLSTELDASLLSQLDAQMSEDVSQLSEVVVVGYSEDDEDKEEEVINTEFAAPLGGRKAYKQYLEKNLRYPEVALNNNIEGRVTIQFTVDTAGSLNDFKVLRSLGYGCDEEVIRLIKQGPGWSATKRGDEVKQSKVKVRMRFALPKK